jgi:hypothetical protein
MRKKNKLLLAVFILSAGLCSAQSVISPAGSIDKTSTVTLEWTLGETAVQSALYNSGMITEGFHQSAIQVTSSLNERAISNHRFTISPNPVISVLDFKSYSLENTRIKILLTDIVGKSISFTEATSNDSKNIDMSMLIAGVYLLTIKDSQGNVLESFRVVKTQ